MEVATAFNLSEGKLNPTGNPLDLAISGAGFFQLRAGEAMLYSREGQFRLAADGRVVSPQGYALQQQGGGDLILEHSAVTIQQDGTVLDEGRPVGRIALMAPGDVSTLRAVGETAFAVDGGAVEPVEGMIRQGMVEASNVSLGDEMVAMTATMRQSEAGARLIQVYDDLIGRVITNLGQGR